MQRKLDDIIQAFREHQFQTSLKLILDFEKKKQKKPPKDVPIGQQTLLAVLKASSLNKLARYGESAAIISALKIPENLDVDHAAILLQVVRDLGLKEKEREVIGKIEAQKELMVGKQKKGYFVVQYCYLNTRRFLDANKFYFNLYNTTKGVVHFFTSVYLQFLDVLQKNGMLMEKKEEVVRVKEGVDWRMVGMFWDKLLGVCSLEKWVGEKEGEEVVKFYVRLAVVRGEYGKAREGLERWRGRMGGFWEELALWKGVWRGEGGEKGLEGLVGCYLRAFRGNTDLAKYRPALDAYVEYVDLLLKTNATKIDEELTGKQQGCQLFVITTPHEQRLNDFFHSLLADLTEKLTFQDKSSDHYKYSVKTSLYSILYLLTRALPNNTSIALPYFQQYTSLFSSTLTFAQEIFFLTPATPFPLVKPQHFKTDNSLVFDLNALKLQYLWKLTPLPKTPEELKETTYKFLDLYRTGLEFQNNEVLEKGERYLADEFISLLSDIFREYLTFNDDCVALLNIISILQTSLLRSPYNFSLKTRLILYYQRLNNPYKLMKIYQTMDIKSSQFQVLNFFIYPQVYGFRLYHEFEEVLLRSLRAYQENEKEIGEYVYNCVEEGRWGRMEEFLSYEGWVGRSYGKVVLWYLLSKVVKGKGGGNERYFVEMAGRALERGGCSWSCDGGVVRSSVNPDREKAAYFGVLNSGEVLRREVRVRLEQLDLMEGKYSTKEKVEEKEYSDVTIGELLNPGYQTLTGVYSYTPVSSVQQHHLSVSLAHHNLLTSLGHYINQYLQHISTPIPPTKISPLLSALLTSSSTLSPSHMILTQEKLSDIIILLNHHIEPLNKRKKKLKEEEGRVLGEMIEMREKCYQIVCGYEGREVEFMLWVEGEEFVKEYRNIEKQLNNWVKVTRREFDKLYKIQQQ